MLIDIYVMTVNGLMRYCLCCLPYQRLPPITIKQSSSLGQMPLGHFDSGLFYRRLFVVLSILMQPLKKVIDKNPLHLLIYRYVVSRFNDPVICIDMCISKDYFGARSKAEILYFTYGLCILPS